jgi:hypothetical protein
MPRRNRSEELDRAVEAILEGDQIPPAPGRGGDDGELTDLLQIAAALRGLPRARFRDELGAALGPQIAAHDLRDAVKDLPPLELRRLGALDRATIGVFRFTGQAPWERHPDGDELIVVLEGGGEITVSARASRPPSPAGQALRLPAASGTTRRDAEHDAPT